MILALHVHTNVSKCAESSIEDIKKFCEDHNIGAIAICDHNEIKGALALSEISNNFKVIIGEEIKTKQGEIIGLFLKSKIEPFKNINDTINEIKSQGAIVYLPHPFDIIRPFQMRMDTIIANIKKIDIIEVFNSKMILPINNMQAKLLALQFKKAEACGSDAHFVKAINCALMEIDDFTGPEEFLENIKKAKFISTINAGVSTTLWSRIKKFFRVRFRFIKSLFRKNFSKY